MMLTQALQEKIQKIIQSFGFELYDIAFLKENKNDILRISIASNQKQVSLDICQEISEAVSPLLDVEIPQCDSYFLEVSSPGVERNLKQPQHFALSLHQKVLVRLDNKEEFEGILVDFGENCATFLCDGIQKKVMLEHIKKAKTILEW